MTLTHQELLELRAADGLAGDDELSELASAGVDVAPVVELRRQIADALRAPDVPDLADRILARLALDGDREVSDVLRAALAAPDVGDVDDAVLAAAELDDGWPTVRGTLRSALAPNAQPDLADAVMAAIGAESSEEAGDLLRRALTPDSAPDISDAVMDRLGLGDPVVVPLPVMANPARRFAPPTGIGYAAFAAAAAAALLVVFLRPIGPSSGAGLAFDLSPVNHVEIEELSSDTAAMVQVLQFDQDAPTIIFIEDPSSADEGATL